MNKAHTYLGNDERGYFAYVDTDTDIMLIAKPGGSYRMRTVEEGFPIPPTDGRWQESAPEPMVEHTMNDDDNTVEEVEQ